MSNTCNCTKVQPEVQIPGVHTLALADVNALSAINTTRLASRAVTFDAAEINSRSAIHTTTDGGVFVTTSSVFNLQGDVALSGSIGPFPVELHISVKLENETVNVSLEVVKPIHLGPFEWKFKLGGIIRDSQGNIIGAQSLSLSPDTPAFEAAGFGSNFLCILKCAGLSILPILIKCLPSLATGPQGFIACVVGQAGSAAAAIAACVAKCVMQ